VTDTTLSSLVVIFAATAAALVLAALISVLTFPILAERVRGTADT
jgi:hypothetical protein